MATLNTRVILRNDSIKNWQDNPSMVLLKGEVGIEFDPDAGTDAAVKFKIGDGTTPWKDLPYYEEKFENDFIFTSAFGKYEPDATGSVTVAAKGKTMTELLTDAFSTEDVDFTVTKPSITLTADSGKGYKSYEVGSKVSPSFSISFNKGSYQYGPEDTGVEVTKYFATFNGETINADEGTFTEITLGDGFNQKVSAYATYADATILPNSNLGNPVENKKITAGQTSTVTGSSLTAYRNSWYYIGTDHTTDIDSDFIRTKGKAKNANTTNFGTLTIPAGTTRVMIAVPGSHSLISVIDVDGMGLDVKGNFEIITGVKVKGANDYAATDYTVFFTEKQEGLAATKYTFSIK